MKKTFYKLLCLILTAVLTLSCVQSFALTADIQTIFDLSGKEFTTTYVGAKYHPAIDGTALTNITFSSKGSLGVWESDDGKALKYSDKPAGADTYMTISTTPRYEGRFIYSGKLYTNCASSDGNMKFALARFYVNYGSGGVNDGSLVVTDKLSSLKAENWYEFKYEIDLYKKHDNITLSVYPEGASAAAGEGFTHSADLKTSVYGKLGFRGGRFDFDLNSKDSGMFVAYRDLKLTYIPNPAKLETYINGNKADGTFKDGVYTSVTTGSGLFALAVYENGKLIYLDASGDDREDAIRKLNAVVEEGNGKTVKIFRFDNSGAPYFENISPRYDSDEGARIYSNWNFSDKGEFLESSNRYTSDGQLYLVSEGTKSEGSYSRPRFGISCKNPGRYIIYEADYSIPETQEKTHRVRLVGGYYHSKAGNTSEVDTYVMTTSGGYIYSGRDSKATKTYGTLGTTPTNIALKIDLEENTYDIYINRELVRSGDSFLPTGSLMPGTTYNSRSFYIGHLSGDSDNAYCKGTLIVDNIKIYEGTEFKSIGDEIPNVSYLDYSDKSPDGVSEVYERPEAEEIAKKVLETSHPRLMINKAKVEEIKNSADPVVISWREKVMASADSALDIQPYKYALSETDSIQDLSEGMSRLMNLGMAYLLTGDTAYSNRAYEEVKILYKVPYVTRYGVEIPEETRDWWNSYNCLDVTEISFMVSLCYDWMYDAWTPEQRDELYYHTAKNGINNMYRNYYGMYLPSPANEDWWKISNNQGAVCNGGAILTGIAFMERDAYRCSQIVEGGIKAIEICLKNFAPDGGWNESASYWAYTLKTFTMACAALEVTCGTNYGLQDTPGLRNSCYYSLAIEGDTGSMSYGDGSADRINAPFLFYWAHAYKDKGIGGAAMYIKNDRGHAPGIYDLIYYDADYIDELSLPEAFYYRGIELVSLRSGNGSGETYVTMLGGVGHGTGHDHLDSGSLIVEMNGERVFHDMGAEYYGAPGYFGANRHLYFRSRPEAHNLFIINPENLTTSDGSSYYGQDKNAVSEVTFYDPDGKKATMDLSDAYARDADSAKRTISLEGKKLVVEDVIELKDVSDIYWNWYVNVKKNKTDKTFTSGNIEISDDGKYAIITRNSKKFKISFEADNAYRLAMEAADYYVNVDPDPGGTKHSNETSRRLALQLEGVSGTVNLKTIIESVE